MEIREIRSPEQLDETLQRDLPELIKESWRKVLQNMGAYTEAYEREEQIWGLEMIKGELARGSRWFVVQEQGAWVATVVVDDSLHEEEPALQFRTLVVHPNAQGRGITQLLIDHLATVAAAENKKHLTLFTSSLLASLVRFYERIGFADYKREEVERYGKRYARVFLNRSVAGAC